MMCFGAPVDIPRYGPRFSSFSFLFITLSLIPSFDCFVAIPRSRSCFFSYSFPPSIALFFLAVLLAVLLGLPLMPSLAFFLNPFLLPIDVFQSSCPANFE